MLNSFTKNKIKSSFRDKYSTFAKDNNWDKQSDVDMLSIYEEVMDCQAKRTPGGYIATCPFPDHQDNTPSFVMYTETNSYFCFGCRKSGTASWFKKEMERIYGL